MMVFPGWLDVEVIFLASEPHSIEEEVVVFINLLSGTLSQVRIKVAPCFELLLGRERKTKRPAVVFVT